MLMQKPGQNFKQNPYQRQSFFQQFWKKVPGKIGEKDRLNSKLGEINNIEHNKGSKKIDLTAKLGEINNIEHSKGSRIYPNQKSQ